METYDLVDALQAHQGQRHSTSCWQTSETCPIRRQPHYGIFHFSAWWTKPPQPKQIQVSVQRDFAAVRQSDPEPL